MAEVTEMAVPANLHAGISIFKATQAIHKYYVHLVKKNGQFIQFKKDFALQNSLQKGLVS